MEWIFSPSELQETPSRRDKLSLFLETQYRKKTTWFLEELAKEMKCDRIVLSTALVLFHRFYGCQSYNQHNRFIIAVTCLFMASKVEEAPKKLREIVSSYFSLRRKFNYTPCDEAEYKELPNKILLAERILLQTLCFDLQLVHPYKHIKDKIKDKLKSYIPNESRQDFHQNAISFLNDSYRTTLCLQYNPQQIAIGAIFLATIQLSVKPVNQIKSRNTIDQSWYELLEPDIDEDVLKGICLQIIDVLEDDIKINRKDETFSELLLRKNAVKEEPSYLPPPIPNTPRLSLENPNPNPNPYAVNQISNEATKKRKSRFD